jgi:uncharacterized membrane protein
VNKRFECLWPSEKIRWWNYPVYLMAGILGSLLFGSFLLGTSLIVYMPLHWLFGSGALLIFVVAIVAVSVYVVRKQSRNALAPSSKSSKL